MRHGRTINKLGRHTSNRKALVRNLLTSLVLKDRIETTLAKAKAVKSWADQMVTLGKRSNMQARRQARRYLYTDDAVTRLFANLAPRFAERHGGYTRILHLGFRRGDAAQMAMLEYLPGPVSKTEKPKADKKTDKKADKKVSKKK